MSPRTRLVVALLSTTLMAYVAVGSLLGRVLGDSTYAQLSVFNEVVRLVLDSYVEPVNLDRAMAGARLGLTDALDGDSAYLDPEEWKAFQAGARENDADVGLVLSRRFAFLAVVSARANSPAEKAGLKPGDIIKLIDGRHTRGVPAVVGQRLLRGAPGSIVKLSLLRSGNETAEVPLVRERLAPAPARSRLVEPGIGYLKVAEFTARTGDEVRAELESLKKAGARKLVLDLRRSAAGDPAEGVKVAELFVRSGVLARVTGSRTPERVYPAEGARVAWEGPTAVLVDHGTAGAAEVVAAALQSVPGTAGLVGQHTFGRAPVQKPFPLPEGGLLLTVARYATPKGDLIHGRGLKPTVAVDLPDAGDGEPAPPADKDPILEKGLELLKADPAARKAA